MVKKLKKLNLKKIKLNKFSQLALLIVIGLVFLTVASTLGRFVYKGLRDSFFNTKNFYFDSDKLKEDEARYEITNYNGVDSYSTIINMNSIKNNKIKATSDISYNLTYTCSSNTLCSISKTSGTIAATTNNDTFTITMAPNEILDDGDTISMYVEASSISPYIKTISATFALKVGKSGLSYEISDSAGDIYAELKITNTLDFYKVIEAFDSYSIGDTINMDTYRALTAAKKIKCASAVITLSFDPTLFRLDMTNSEFLKGRNTSTETLNGYNYIDGFTFSMDAISSVTIKFYKVTKSANYTYNGMGVSQISVVYS